MKHSTMKHEVLNIKELMNIYRKYCSPEQLEMLTKRGETTKAVLGQREPDPLFLAILLSMIADEVSGERTTTKLVDEIYERWNGQRVSISDAISVICCMTQNVVERLGGTEAPGDGGREVLWAIMTLVIGVIESKDLIDKMEGREIDPHPGNGEIH